MANKRVPIGLKLNNPANIRYNPSNHWKGQIGKEKGFVFFCSRVYGIRALIVLLGRYKERGYDTIEKIISRFAPAADGNNTEGYIEYVCSRFSTVGLDKFEYIQDRSDVLALDDLAVLELLCSSICMMETGFYLEHWTFMAAVDLLSTHNK